jgi:DNA helicase-2/ATP-dependent DNA helicase PcrA
MIALTFTRLAGKEMKERVINLIGESKGKELFCNTFHAFCVKVIKEHGHELGYDEDFTIYDQEDKDSIIKSIIKDYKYKVTLDEVLTRIAENFFYPYGDETDAVIGEYRYRLKQNNAIDLDFLLIDALKLLQKPHISELYSCLYEYVFVDEFQDTNDTQMKIIKALNPKNLFVVGDDFQSIYGWRQAKPEYIINFQQYYPKCEVIKLEDNYRSTGNIIEAANNLISHNVNQTKKILKAHKEGPEVEIVEAENIEQEINLIISSILEGEHYCDFAILTRTNKQMEPFIDAFQNFNIPYQLISNKDDPLRKPDIKMIFNVLEFILNPKDDMTLKKILNFPERRVSELRMHELEKLQIDTSSSLIDMLDEVPEFTDFLNKIELMRYEMFEGEAYSALDNFYAVINGLGLKRQYESEGRANKVQDIAIAAEYIKHWEGIQSNLGENVDISSFLRWMHLKDIQEKFMEERDAVKIMTVHASKGLEFPVVFVMGLNQDTFPSKRGDIEEERRLFYVAITRAKERLYITRSTTTMGYNHQTMYTRKSQFITEMKEEYSAKDSMPVDML